MRNNFIFFSIMLAYPAISFCDNIELKYTKEPPTRHEIPVNVDVTDKILNIIIMGNFEAEVIVTGPDGVVYQSRINAKIFTAYIQGNGSRMERETKAARTWIQI